MIKEREALEIALKALEKIAFAGMAAPPEMSEEGRTKWHAQQAFNFIGIAAWAVDSVKETLTQNSNSVEHGLFVGMIAKHPGLAEELTQAEQEPMAWIMPKNKRNGYNMRSIIEGKEMPPIGEWKPLYITPPKLEWVELTSKEVLEIYTEFYRPKPPQQFAKDISAKLKELNH